MPQKEKQCASREKAPALSITTKKENIMIKRNLITKEDYMGVHIAMWQWLADNPRKAKGDWPGWATIDKMNSHCPACGWALAQVGPSCSMGHRCTACPIKEYRNETGGHRARTACCHPGTTYDKWWRASRHLDHPSRVQNRGQYAKEIRDMEWTEV